MGVLYWIIAILTDSGTGGKPYLRIELLEESAVLEGTTWHEIFYNACLDEATMSIVVWVVTDDDDWRETACYRRMGDGIPMGGPFMMRAEAAKVYHDHKDMVHVTSTMRVSI